MCASHSESFRRMHASCHIMLPNSVTHHSCSAVSPCPACAACAAVPTGYVFFSQRDSPGRDFLCERIGQQSLTDFARRCNDVAACTAFVAYQDHAGGRWLCLKSFGRPAYPLQAAQSDACNGLYIQGGCPNARFSCREDWRACRVTRGHFAVHSGRGAAAGCGAPAQPMQQSPHTCRQQWQ